MQNFTRAKQFSIQFAKQIFACCRASGVVGIGLFIVFISLLGACSSDLENPEAGEAVDLRNISTGKVDLEVQELRQDPQAQQAELVLVYSLSGIDPQTLPPGASLTITVVDERGLTIAISDAIPLQTQGNVGQVVLMVPTGTGDQVTAVAEVQVADESSGEVVTEETAALLEIDLSNAVQPTDLGNVQGFSLELVDGSYESSASNLRRIHRFAVRVYQEAQLGQDPALDCVSIRGLDADVGEYFTMLEDSFFDEESPVTSDVRDSFIRVYFVLDASSSIGSSETVQVINAARYASNRLLDDYVVDFRQFNGDIQRLANFEDYQPDIGESATAFYYAIDTVLQDIEARGRNEDYNVIIGFTDGIDRASRNHFGSAFSHEDVRSLVLGRIAQFRENAANATFDFGSGLELHVLSVGNAEAETGNLDELARVGGGRHVFAESKESLEPDLESLVDNILATYHLQYSSQQVAADTDLRLEVAINSGLRSVQIQQAGGLQAATGPHRCRQR